MYSTALYVHLLAVAGAFFGMGMMLSSLVQARGATRVSEALRFCDNAAKASKIMPLASVLLLLTGGYMAQNRWNWSLAWVDLSIVGLLLVTFFGAGVLGSRERSLHKALERAQAENLDAKLETLVRSPFLVTGSGMNAGLVCAVMFVMVAKPGWTGGIVAMLLGILAGYAVFSAAARRANANAPAPAASPSRP